MQKKILILNGAHSDIPLIDAAHNLGLYVITSGNNPSLIGHKYGDKYVPGDFSNCEEMLKIAKEEKVDYVCSCANDFGIISAAYVAEKLGLGGHDSYETTLRLHHKDKFKQMVKDYNLRSAKGERFTDEKAALDYALSLDYPLMVKPVDLTGGKGVSKVNTKEEKIEAIKKAFSMGHANTIVIEQFIQGTYHSFSTFIVNKKVVLAYSDNEYPYHSPFYCAISGGPATGIEYVKDKLIEEAEKIAKILNLVDGKLHCQYIMDENHEPYIIEYTRRLCGDMYCEPVSRALGIDAADLVVRAECGMDVTDCPKDKEQKGHTGRHILITPHNGIVDGINIDKNIKNHIYKDFIWWKKGDEIKDYWNDKLGIIFYDFDTDKHMIDSIESLKQLITYDYR